MGQRAFYRNPGHGAAALRTLVASTAIPLCLLCAQPATGTDAGRGEPYDATIPLERIADDASAQALPEPVQLGEIAVTGTRIKRTDYETAFPVFTLSRDDIERSGVTSLGKLLQDLAIAGSASNTSVSNSDVGTVEVDLRNLGSQRVLVLVNGRRWVGGMYFYSTGSADLSTIPLSAIERIEVLKDGASVIYGSDAIAGVVNILTRKDAAGAELRVQLGAYANENDGQRAAVGLSWSGFLGRSSLFLDLDHARENGIHNADRELTRFYRLGVGTTRGTPFTPRGTLIFVPTPENGAILGEELCPTDPGSGLQFCNMILRHGQTITGDANENTQTVAPRYEPFDSTSTDEAINDLYDPNAILYLSFPNERTSLFATLHHPFANGIALSGEFLYLRRKLRQDIPAFTLLGDFGPERFSDIFVAADNPFNPFDQDIGRSDAMGLGGGIVLKTLSQLTPVVAESAVESFRIGAGLDGTLDDLLSQWQAGFVYAKSRNYRSTATRPILDRFALALGPAAECSSQPGCVPLNIFGGPGAITQPMLDYITYPSDYPKEQWLGTAYVTVTSDLAALPAGLLKAAYGLEYRKEYYADFPDALIVACRSGCFAPTAGSFDVKEAFVEVGIPLLSGRRFAQALDLNLAARHSSYNTFGDDTNYKLGLRWKPADTWLLRATASTGFRAPAISELYLTPADLTFSGLSDPCSDYAGQQGGEPAAQDTQDNCRSAGVPDTYVQPATIPGHDGGNPDLGAESARTYTAGFVYSPDVWPDLSAGVDWYRIELSDSITLLDLQAILDSCYQPAGGSETCSLIARDPDTGEITDLRFQPLNIGANHVEGVDAAVAIALPARRKLGQFQLALNLSYLTENVLLLAGSDGQQQGTSRQGTATPLNAFPRLKANAELQWSRGMWQASWRARYIHHQTETCDDGIVPSLTELGRCSEPNTDDPSRSLNQRRAVTYHDVQLSLDLPGWDTRLTLGARNLFDQDPPPSYTNLYNAFDPSTYDLPGVFAYIRVSSSF